MSTAPTYPHLLSPTTIGGLELRNRVVMGSMHTGLEDRARDLGALSAYFAERARGGVGEDGSARAQAMPPGHAPRCYPTCTRR